MQSKVKHNLMPIHLIDVEIKVKKFDLLLELNEMNLGTMNVFIKFGFAKIFHSGSKWWTS